MIPMQTSLRNAAGLALAALLGWSALGLAQAPAPARPKDQAVDDLLRKVEESSKAKDAPKAKKDDPKPAKPGGLSTRDKELDDLLGKSDEKDAPSPDGPKPPPPPGGDKSDKPDPGQGDDKGKKDKADKQPDQAKGDKKPGKPKGLAGQDEELDDHLAGKPKKSQSGQKPKGQGQGKGKGEEDGPMGDLIKQMREVEQRLGQPDTGEQTRQKQTEIVKKLDTMIEQMRQSQTQGQAMRMIRQGNQPGKQPGQQQGAMAQGPPPMQPEKNRVSGLDLKDKDTWGHLQQALRDEMENVFKEGYLPSKEDLIRRYYMAVNKKTLSRGE